MENLFDNTDEETRSDEQLSQMVGIVNEYHKWSTNPF